eukprot:gene17378-23680_t
MGTASGSGTMATSQVAPVAEMTEVPDDQSGQPGQAAFGQNNIDRNQPGGRLDGQQVVGGNFPVPGA